MTVFRRMLPLLTSHNLVTADTEKTHDCVACIQGNTSRDHRIEYHQLNFSHLFIDFLGIYVVQLTHLHGHLDIILS